MRLKTLLMFASVCLASRASEVTISVSEITFDRVVEPGAAVRLKTVQKFTDFVCDTAQVAVVHATPFRGRPLARFDKYLITERKLCRDGHLLLPADRILFQGTIDGQDFIVVQSTRVSLNPLYLPAALSGHPIQFGEIWMVAIDRDGRMKKSCLIDASKAGDWRAEVYEREGSQPAPAAPVGRG